MSLPLVNESTLDVKWKVSILTKYAGANRVRLFHEGYRRLSEVRRVIEEIVRNPVRHDIQTTHGEPLEGEWRFLNPVWRRDAQERTSGDATYTLIVDAVAGTASSTLGGGDSCSESRKIEYHWDEAFVIDPPASSQGTVTRIGGVDRDKDTGLWSYYVEIVTDKTYQLREYTAEHDTFKKIDMSAFLNVYVDGSGNLKDESGATVVVSEVGLSSIDGTLTTQRRRKNPSCTTDIEVTKAKPLGVDPAASSHSVTNFVQEDQVTKRNQASEQASVELDTTNAIITEVKSERTESDLWNQATTERKALLAEPFTYTSETRGDRTTETTQKRNATTQESAVRTEGEAAKSAVVQTKSDVNEFRRYDTERVAISPVIQGVEFKSEYRGDRTVLTTIARNAVLKADADKILNRVIQVTSRKNEFDRYDNERVVTSPTLQTSTFQSEAQATRKSDTIITSNSDVKTEAAKLAGEEHKVVQASSKLNEFDKFDNQRTVISPLTVDDIVVSAGGPLASSVTTTQENQVASANPGAVVVGKITEASSDRNEFDLFHNRVAVRTAHKAGPISATSGGPVVSVTESHSRNASSPEDPGVGVVGHINDVSNSINEFGLYDVHKSVRTANRVGPISATSGGPVVSVTESHSRNASSPEDPGVGVVGKINDVSNSINEFGLYDVRKTVKQAVRKSTGNFTYGDKRHTVTESSTRNEDSVVSLPPNKGESVSLGYRVNDFGKFEKSVVVTTENEINISGLTNTGSSSYFLTRKVEEKSGQGSPLVVLSHSPGANIVQVESSAGDNQLYRTKKTENNPHARDTGWVDYADRYGKSQYRQWWNQVIGFGKTILPVEPSESFATYNTSLAVKQNEFGLEDGTATKIKHQGTGKTDTYPISWHVYQLGKTIVSEDGTQYRQVKYCKLVNTSSSFSGAWNDIKTLNPDTRYTGGTIPMLVDRSDVVSLTLATGERRWLAVVFTTPHTVTAWADIT